MAVDEITPQQLESELTRSADVAVVDVRPSAEADRWRIDTNGLPFANIPSDQLVADPDAAIAAIREVARNGTDVRLICNRGRASLRAAQALDEHGLSCASVAGGMLAWSRLLSPRPIELTGDTTVIQFMREARGCLSYLVASGGEALIVDPAPSVEPYIAAARSIGARIVRVVDTHVHADHLSGARALADREGAVIHLSTGALARGVRYTQAVDPLSDGDNLELGSADVRVLALPGHTTDNIGLLVDGQALIAGDSLFADSVARPDLEAGDAGAADAARTLFATLQERILPLPAETLLLPCHYPGGRRDEALAPTLGEVRSNVDFLSMDREEFARESVADMPPRPANYLNIIAVNLGAESGPDVGGLEVGANSCAAR